MNLEEPGQGYLGALSLLGSLRTYLLAMEDTVGSSYGFLERISVQIT